MKTRNVIFRFLVLSVLAFFFYLLFLITIQYIPFRDDAAFLAIKSSEVQLMHYVPFFKVHVFSSIFLLLAGFTQFSAKLRINRGKLHRTIGWFYGIILVLFSAPSGLVLGFYANGGRQSQIAFLILGLLWIYTTVQAIRYAKKKEWTKHRNFMIRSYALTLSAITLRLWKYIIVALLHPPPMDVYRIVAWLGWILNIIVAESIIFYNTRKSYVKLGSR